MRKPSTNKECCQEDDNVAELMTEVLKLRRENEEREN